jgi:hypothetical protein
MAAFNTVERVDEVCPRCTRHITRAVQFKFGDTWQHVYKIGDHVDWGGNDVGEEGRQLVTVHGYPEPCPVCGHVPEGLSYDVIIQSDVIRDVRPSERAGEYAKEGRDWIVLEV